MDADYNQLVPLVTTHSNHPRYRSDIDGLRAVAVLLVIADHLRTHFSGGYVGVDVFFVISGYLISSAILNEMSDGSFSVVRFYERRVRRIFPALIVVLLATCVPAYRYLFPIELADFARSLLAAVFSVSNFWFWHQAGYFSAPSAFKPLLHTWSLAVEEQFYIFFPLMLVLIRRLAPRRLKPAILLVTAISFVLALWCVHRDASAAFYFSPLRAWELLIGTIVSQRYMPSIRGVVARNLAAATGLGLILAPAWIYTATTPFPGLAAVAPCLGAALIIAGGEYGSSLVGRILSLRPVVFVGLISYSLYLWHWPILAFQNVGGMLSALPEHDRRLKAGMFLLSLILGYLSWRFIETPFRKGRYRPDKKPLFLINGAGVLAVTVIAACFLSFHGLPGRFPPDALAAAQYLDYDRRAPFREGTCFLSSENNFADFASQTCLAESSSKPNVLIFGDSEAAQLWFGMQTVYPDVNFLQATAFACPLYAQPTPGASQACRDLANYMHTRFLPTHKFDAVLFSGRWLDADIPFLDRELAWMKQHGIKVYLLGPVVEYDQAFPRVLADSLRYAKPDSIKRHEVLGAQVLDEQMAKLARERWGVPYVSYFETLCQPECPAYAAPGVPLLFDEHHLTADGSTAFAQALRTRGVLPFSQWITAPQPRT